MGEPVRTDYCTHLRTFEPLPGDFFCASDLLLVHRLAKNHQILNETNQS